MPGEANRSLIHKGRKFDLERVSLRADDGRAIEREVIRHPGAVCILPVLEANDGPRIVLISNLRPAVGSRLWELPAGTLEPDEAPDRCASRELEEETGYRAGSVTPLAAFYTTPGITDEKMHAFIATGLGHIGQNTEQDEHIEVHPFTPAEMASMIDSGELMDAKSLLTIFIAHRKGFLPFDLPEAE